MSKRREGLCNTLFVWLPFSIMVTWGGHSVLAEGRGAGLQGHASSSDPPVCWIHIFCPSIMPSFLSVRYKACFAVPTKITRSKIASPSIRPKSWFYFRSKIQRPRGKFNFLFHNLRFLSQLQWVSVVHKAIKQYDLLFSLRIRKITGLHHARSVSRTNFYFQFLFTGKTPILHSML